MTISIGLGEEDSPALNPFRAPFAKKPEEEEFTIG